MHFGACQFDYMHFDMCQFDYLSNPKPQTKNAHFVCLWTKSHAYSQFYIQYKGSEWPNSL